MVCRNPEMSEDLLIPESLHIYNVKIDETKVLGKGSYGVVYEACYHGAKVAVKKLHSIFFEDVSTAENIGILKSWRNELQLMSKILHPNIVQFYGVYNSESQKNVKLSGNTFIVSELMHKSLRARNLETPKLKYNEIVNILHDIGAGLCYLHVRPSPIMHRDLASKNILLTTSGRAKIADLGVAKIVSQKQESLTRHPGTDAYMPVEAIAFENGYDCSIDIYALGVIGLELGIGRDPKATQCLKKVGLTYVPVEETERRKEDFAELESSCNVDLKKFILQCLDKMESRITAITALQLLQKHKDSDYYKQQVEKTTTALKSTYIGDISYLEEQNSKLKDQLKKDSDENQKKLLALDDMLNNAKKELERYEVLVQTKDNELEKLKKDLESKKQTSRYISRDPPSVPSSVPPSVSTSVPPSQYRHYNYSSTLNQKSQSSMSSHGKLVIPGSVTNRSTFSRQPTIGSYQVHSTKGRPASTIVTGTSHSTDRTYMTQRSHSEDNCLSSETKYPPSLPINTVPSSQSSSLSMQSVIHSLTQYHIQIDDGFKKVKIADSALWMGTYMLALKQIMEEVQSYMKTIPLNIRTDPEVNQWLIKLGGHIELLKKVNLDKISGDNTDRLSLAARILQAQL